MLSTQMFVCTVHYIMTWLSLLNSSNSLEYATGIIQFISCALTYTHNPAHQSCSRPGPDCELPWACPPSQSPSYRRSGCEPPIKDQSKEDRIPHHARAQSSPPPANHSLQLQRDKSQFEQEVAGSLDDALKQLLSDS